jgi:hypothetical protein
MTYYVKHGNIFSVTDSRAVDIRDSLPAGNYTVKQNPISKEFFLEQIMDFAYNGKVYGDLEKNALRMLNTYEDRPNSTGILLAGEKGSGKTMLARLIAAKANDRGYPCIVINTAFTGDDFNKFIQTIEQPTVILFDEFEKVYKDEDQEKMLTLLDGVYPGKKLFVLTCNDKWRIDKHMRNRPGRIYYMLNFKGLEEEFIREYCNDVLLNKNYINQICNVSALFSEFNFDMLKALCEEMNRYGESPEQALKMLNAKPENGEKSRYAITLLVEDKVMDLPHTDTWEGNPLSAGSIRVNYRHKFKDENGEDDWNWEDYTAEIGDLISINPENQSFTYVNKDGKLILTRVKEKTWDYSKVL